MAASKKEHLVPGKQIHVTKQGNNFVFCEVALMTGTSKANAIADFYNSTGTDICTPERFAGSRRSRRSRTRAAHGVSSSTRRGTWMFDEFDVYEDGVERTFGGIKMTWMGVVPVEQLEKGGHHGPLRARLHLPG